MASLTMSVGIKETEAFTVLIGMKDDITDAVDLIPDYMPEKLEIQSRLNEKWKRMVELVEISH